MSTLRSAHGSAPSCLVPHGRSDGNREKINFYVYYDIDEAEVKTLLRTEWYDGDEEGSWVLLEPVE